VNAGALKARANRAAGLDTGAGASRPQNDPRCAGDGPDLVWDGLANARHDDHGFPGSFFGFPDGVGNAAGFTEADTDLSFVVADHYKDRPGGGFAALVRLKHLVRPNDPNVELRAFGVAALTLAAESVHHSHTLKLQSRFTSTFGEAGDAAMVAEPASIEDDLGDSFGSGTLSQLGTDLLRSAGISVSCEFLFKAARAAEGLAGMCLRLRKTASLGLSEVPWILLRSRSCRAILESFRLFFAIFRCPLISSRRRVCRP
jgi:hypothetical protein